MPSSNNLWGEAYARKADAFAATPHWKEEAAAALLTMALEVPSGGLVLDFGCNTGRFIEMAQYSQPDLQYVGVDVNEAGLAIARKRIPNVEFGTSIPEILEPESVDHVVCIHTLPQIIDLETALSEVWGCMKRGATITVITHNKWRGWLNAPKNLFNGYKGDATMQREFGAGGLKYCLWDAGFLCDSVEYFGSHPVPLLRNRIIYHGRKPGDPTLF